MASNAGAIEQLERKMNRALRFFFKAIAEPGMKNRLYTSMAVALLLATVNPHFGVMAQRPFAGILYKSLFHDAPVAKIKTANLPEDLKRRLVEYKIEA